MSTVQQTEIEIVYDSLRPVAIGVGVLYAFLAISHTLLLPAPIASIMMWVAVATAVTLLALQYALGRWPPPERWVHPIAAFIVGLALGNSLLHLYLTGQLQQTTHILFVMAGLGFFFLSARWFALALTVTLLAWGVVVRQIPSSPDLVHYGFVLFMGTVLSVLIFFVRRRTFQRYESLRRADQQRRRELRYRAGQLETSIAVGHHITSILDLDVLLSQVVELIKARYGYYFVGVFLLEEDGEHAQVRAGTGEAGRILCRQEFRLRVGDEGLIGWVAANGRVACVNDVMQDGRYVHVDAVPDARSELDLPLRMGEAMLGVLTLQSERLAAFAEDDVPFMRLLADQVAIAIHNASSYQDEVSARRLAQTVSRMGRALGSVLDREKVLDLILEQLAQIVAYDRAAVLVRQGKVLVIVAARGFPPQSQPLQIQISIDHDEESIYREIYRTQRPLAIPDVSKRPDWQQLETLPVARAWLGVPLIRADEVTGMLSLTRETPDVYHNEEIVIATAFAGHAAVALGNVHIYEKLARFNQQLEYEVHQRTEAIQEAYDQLERLDRTKTDFITIASHELRTPLTILRGYSQMLLKDKAILADGRRRRLVSGIQSGAVRLEEVISAMVNVAKIDSRALELYPEPVSIPAIIQLVCEEFGKALADRRLTLVLEEMNGMPAIEADPEALYKVFYHLIVNAIKYTPDGGSITISGGPLRWRELDWPSEGVEIVIHDTGIGIDPDFHELIFTKFYQTGKVALHSTAKTAFKGGGPGLGLAIARGIVEAHRGQLWVESKGYDEAKCPGSQFHVVLPLGQN